MPISLAFHLQSADPSNITLRSINCLLTLQSSYPSNIALCGINCFFALLLQSANPSDITLCSVNRLLALQSSNPSDIALCSVDRLFAFFLFALVYKVLSVDEQETYWTSNIHWKSKSLCCEEEGRDGTGKLHD
jgi:hypothetical protein